MSFQFGAAPEAMATFVSASSNPEHAADGCWGNNGGFYRRYLISCSAASTISEGQPLAFNYSTNFASAFPITGGPIVPVSAQLTEASSTSHIAFAAQPLTFTAAGIAQIIGQVAGPGKVLCRGSGASASVLGGCIVSFAANSGYIVGAVNAVPVSSALQLYGRVMAASTNVSADTRTIGSATTDTALVDCYIVNQRFPYGIA